MVKSEKKKSLPIPFKQHNIGTSIIYQHIFLVENILKKKKGSFDTEFHSDLYYIMGVSVCIVPYKPPWIFLQLQATISALTYV